MLGLVCKPIVAFLFFVILREASSAAIFPCDTQPVKVNVVNNTWLTYNGSFNANESCVWQLNVPDDSYMTIDYSYFSRNGSMRDNDLQFIGQSGQVFYSQPSSSSPYDYALRVPSFRGYTAVNATLLFTNATRLAQFNITLALFPVSLYNMSSSKSYRIGFTKQVHTDRSGHAITFDPTNTHYILIQPLWFFTTSVSDFSHFVNIRAPNSNITRLSSVEGQSLVIPGNTVTVTLDMTFSNLHYSYSDNLYIVGLNALPEVNATTLFWPGALYTTLYPTNQTVVVLTNAEYNWCQASLTLDKNTSVDVYFGDSRRLPIDNSSYIMTLNSNNQYSEFLFIGDAYTFAVREGYFGISCSPYPNSDYRNGITANSTGAVISQGYPLSVPANSNQTSTSFTVFSSYRKMNVHYNYRVTLAGNESSFTFSTSNSNTRTFQGPGDFAKSGSPSHLTVNFTSASTNDRFVLIYKVAMPTTTSWLLVSTLLCVFNG